MNAQNLIRIVQHFIQARYRWHSLHGTRLQQYQERRAGQIVAYTAQHAPFYREHWAGHDLQDWRNLPTVDKKLMMEHFDSFNTRGIPRKAAMEVALKAEQSRDFRPVLDGLTVGLSSGTSGHRGLFLVSDREQAGWAGTMLARALHQLRPRRLKVAFFLRSNSNLYEQIGGIVIQFRYFDLMLPLQEAVTTLNEFQPDIVVGPPSLLGFLAKEQTTGKLHICPERLISVAEVLEPQDRERLQSVFNVPVHQIYQCTEGLLAVSCDKGSLHIQEDIVALQFEPLSEQDSTRVMPIVTDLWRTTQPIIRYRLNDVLQLETQPCPCGSNFRVIRTIEGRSDDICYFIARDSSLRPFFPDTLRRMILLASPHITDYQLVQEREGQLHIYLEIDTNEHWHEVTVSVQQSVEHILAQYGCRPAQLLVEQGLCPVAPAVKRRRVQRMAHYHD